MRSSRGTPVSVVPVSVNVHAALGISVVAGDVPGDGRLGALGGLLEGHGALDVGVATEDGNCGDEDCGLARSFLGSVVCMRLVGELGTGRRQDHQGRLGDDAV